MLTLNEVNNYWQYCLSIERNLDKTTEFVEVCSDNKAAYSFEFAKIIMLACSEIDVLCRLLCKQIDPASDFDDSSTRSGKIDDYARVILKRFPKITTFKLLNTKEKCNIIPFAGWAHTIMYKEIQTEKE